MGAREYFRHFFGFENFGPVIFLGRQKICPNEHPYPRFYRVPPLGRLSAIIWKPAKTLFATPCDSLRSLSQAVAEIKNFLSLRLTATRCDPLRLMETTVHNFCNSLR